MYGAKDLRGVRGTIVERGPAQLLVQIRDAETEWVPIPSALPQAAGPGDWVSIRLTPRPELIRFRWRRWNDEMVHTERATFRYWRFETQGGYKTHRCFSLDVAGFALISDRRVDEDDSAKRACHRLSENVDRQVWVEVQNGIYVPNTIMLY